MVRKKKDDIELDNYDAGNEWEDEDQPDPPLEDLDDLDTTIPEQEDITNSLQLANKTLEPSKIVKQLPEALPEIRIAFLDSQAAKEVKHSAKNYDNFRYIRKILHLQKIEDDRSNNNREKLYSMTSKEDLKEYLQSINRSYLYTILEDSNQLGVALDAAKHIKSNGLAQDFQNITHNLHTLYEEYNTSKKKDSNVDDTGQIQNIAMETTVSSGRAGNERYALISTIASTKNLDSDSPKVKAVREKTFTNNVKNLAKRYI